MVNLPSEAVAATRAASRPLDAPPSRWIPYVHWLVPPAQAMGNIEGTTVVPTLVEVASSTGSNLQSVVILENTCQAVGVMDQDTQAVIDRLNEALSKSGLSLRQFAHALGTSPSRFSAYRSGQTAPSAAFLLRAERIAEALSQARRDRIPSSIDAVNSLRRAAKRGDEDWTYALALEMRDRLHDVLLNHKDLAPAWEAQPPPIETRWKALTAAFVGREFSEAGLAPPRWTAAEPLDSEWVLDTPRLTEDEIKQQTPAWLAERNIFIAAKDLATA